MAIDAPKTRPRILTRAVVILGIGFLLWAARFAYDYFDSNSPANLATQVQLKLFGVAIYEYHSHTGRWPTSVDDLAQTSLPSQSRVWQQTADAIVFLWPQNLKPEPKDNAHELLAYWKGGLFNKFGRVWVCWGDLRTEQIRKSQIHLVSRIASDSQ
jgi:hypothetical protein